MKDGGRPISLCAGVMSLTAVCMSYAINQSLLWAFLHMFFGGFYVVYWLFSYTQFREWIMQWVVY